jgi:hypothetical protein
MAKIFKKLANKILFIAARISWKKVTNPLCLKKENESDFTIGSRKGLLEVFAPIFGIATSRTLLLFHLDNTNHMFFHLKLFQV